MGKLFISHIAEEAGVAIAVKHQLERAFDDVEVFVSSEDVDLGEAWLSSLLKAMDGAKAVLVLCSPWSTERRWINFEAGGGFGNKSRVIPICYDGMLKDELPYPLTMFQGLDLDDRDSCDRLVRALAKKLDLTISASFDPDAMCEAFVPVLPERKPMIGIDLAHGQAEWPDDGRASVFGLPETLPNEKRWSFRKLRTRDQLLTVKLHEFSGLIVGMPFRKEMDGEVAMALERWVRAGGHLLLLGYELGDRHHEGNLHELSRRFGIHPMIDIVGPYDFKGRKPYDEDVSFAISQVAHPLVAGLDFIRMQRVQTLYVEPGGEEVLLTGSENMAFRPVEGVAYRDGKLVDLRAKMTFAGVPDWRPVVVEAPKDLCGRGAVIAIGTWELFDEAGGTRVFLGRLFDWLASAPPARTGS